MVFLSKFKCWIYIDFWYYLGRCSGSGSGDGGISKNWDFGSWSSGFRRVWGWNGGGCVIVGGKGSSIFVVGIFNEILDYRN